ncbi:MAG: ribosomal L7Ae/L30e/S12e/Gadd45 family protein, partial [Eubacterium sp.]|nr:ribosomal L7Ae/L30e/S12e/Gadd45 family protein [Eubacterium sp.]
KSGNIASGEFQVEEAIKKYKAYLVIIASDASGGTKKKFMNSCKYYEVPVAQAYDKETLGRAIGKKERAVVAVLNEGFANKLKNNLEREVN